MTDTPRPSWIIRPHNARRLCGEGSQLGVRRRPFQTPHGHKNKKQKTTTTRVDGRIRSVAEGANAEARAALNDRAVSLAHPSAAGRTAGPLGTRWRIKFLMGNEERCCWTQIPESAAASAKDAYRSAGQAVCSETNPPPPPTRRPASWQRIFTGATVCCFFVVSSPQTDGRTSVHSASPDETGRKISPRPTTTRPATAVCQDLGIPRPQGHFYLFSIVPGRPDGRKIEWPGRSVYLRRRTSRSRIRLGVRWPRCRRTWPWR